MTLQEAEAQQGEGRLHRGRNPRSRLHPEGEEGFQKPLVVTRTGGLTAELGILLYFQEIECRCQKKNSNDGLELENSRINLVWMERWAEGYHFILPRLSTESSHGHQYQ